MLGYNPTKETRSRMSEAAKARDPATYQSSRDRAVPVVAIKGDEILYFRSRSYAVSLGGFTKASLAKVFQGKAKTHKGYKWMTYKEFMNASVS
jgi:hypothetical protein